MKSVDFNMASLIQTQVNSTRLVLPCSCEDDSSLSQYLMKISHVWKEECKLEMFLSWSAGVLRVRVDLLNGFLRHGNWQLTEHQFM